MATTDLTLNNVTFHEDAEGNRWLCFRTKDKSACALNIAAEFPEGRVVHTVIRKWANEQLAAEERVRELTKEADEIRHEIVQCDDIKLDQPIVNCIADMQKDREQKWERLSVMETALKQIWAIARNSRRSTHVEDLDEIQARANQALSDQGGNNGA